MVVSKKLKTDCTPKYSLKLAVTALTLASFLVYLGMWQIGRANEKKFLLSTLHARVQQAAVPLESLVNPNLDNSRFMPITLNVNEHITSIFLLDNQMLDGRRGYRVITPVKLSGQSASILLDHGWLPHQKSYPKQQILQLIQSSGEFIGIINHIPTGIRLRQQNTNLPSTSPLIIQHIDYDQLSTYLESKVLPFVVQLTNSQLTYPGINLGVSVNKHLGYAMQWFTFAGLVILYSMFTCRKDKAKNEQRSQQQYSAS